MCDQSTLHATGIPRVGVHGFAIPHKATCTRGRRPIHPGKFPLAHPLLSRARLKLLTEYTHPTNLCKHQAVLDVPREL